MGLKADNLNNKRKEMMIFNNLMKQTPELLKRGALIYAPSPRALAEALVHINKETQQNERKEK